MKTFRSYILFAWSVVIYSGCQTKDGSNSESKILHWADLKNARYQITDSSLTITEGNEIKQINFIILDSAEIANSDKKLYTIGVESFSKETPDHIKEITALTIGKKIGASQIRILKDRESYVAGVTSDLSGKGKEIDKLLQESWEFSYILK